NVGGSWSGEFMDGRSGRPGKSRFQSTPLTPLVAARRAVAREHDLDGLKEDAEIQPERHVLEVVEVVADLLHLLRERVRVPIADLRRAGVPWPDRAPERVVRDRVA